MIHKRIAFISTTATSLNQTMRGQLEFFRSRGAEIDLYSGGPAEALRTLEARGAGRVRHVPFRRQPNLFWDAVSFVWLMIQLAMRRYDAVVCSTPKAMLLGSISSFLTLQPRRIAWVRGRAYENYSGGKRRLYVALDRMTFRTASAVLFVSRSLMEAYRNDGVELGTKAVLLGNGSSNGVDVQRFSPLPPHQREAVRARLGISPSDFLVVIVGRIRKDKGAGELIELLERLRDVEPLKVIMVGPFEDNEIERAFLSQHLPALICHPEMSKVEPIFQCADLHLTLSHREGMSNVALEAAACGVPSFGFDVVGVRDAIVEGETGELFEPGDLDSLERAIREAVKEGAEFRERYAGARKIVSACFGQERLWRLHERLFFELADDDCVPVPCSDLTNS